MAQTEQQEDKMATHHVYCPQVGDFLAIVERGFVRTAIVTDVKNTQVFYCYGKPQANVKYGEYSDAPAYKFLLSFFDHDKTPCTKLNFNDFDQIQKTRWTAIRRELEQNGYLKKQV